MDYAYYCNCEARPKGWILNAIVLSDKFNGNFYESSMNKWRVGWCYSALLPVFSYRRFPENPIIFSLFPKCRLRTGKGPYFLLRPLIAELYIWRRFMTSKRVLLSPTTASQLLNNFLYRSVLLPWLRYQSLNSLVGEWRKRVIFSAFSLHLTVLVGPRKLFS